MTESDQLIAVGKFSGTHGVRGSLKLYSYSGNIQSLKEATSVQLRNKNGSLVTYSIKSISVHGNVFLLALCEISDLNEAQLLVGSELFLYRSQLPVPDDDEYYWCDLIGLTVITDQGVLLGTIAEIFETASSDIYVVRNNENREYLIPAIADVISKVDLAEKTVVITPLEGLLDL